jgi:penicillin-binding protein 2
MLMGQYPNDEDMAAVQKGQAGAPVGKPRRVAEMMALLPGGSGLLVPEAPRVVASAVSLAVIPVKAVQPADAAKTVIKPAAATSGLPLR